MSSLACPHVVNFLTRTANSPGVPHPPPPRSVASETLFTRPTFCRFRFFGPRCLSTVYVAAEVKDGLVYYSTDSDAMITKGLAGLLAMGLSGNSPEAIQAVKPEFIQVAGLQASLTAG